MPRVLHVVNDITDPAELFVEEFERRGFGVDTRHPHAGEDLPGSIDGYSVMVATGGRMDTHQADDHPWMHREMELIRETVQQGVPYLGLCLGAQLLSAATGGEVYRCEPHEVGWWDVELTPSAADDLLFHDLPSPFTAMQWHYYACRPSEAVELARNPTCTQGFRVGECAWGTQFHIEVTRPQLLGWLEAAEDDLAANGWPRPAFMRSLDEQLPPHSQIGRTLAHRLADEAERRAGPR